MRNTGTLKFTTPSDRELGMTRVFDAPRRKEMKEIAPPERLVSTESWGGDRPETLNTLTLSEKNGKTTIMSWVLYPSKEARDAALKTGMKEGVSQSFVRLAKYLRTMT